MYGIYAANYDGDFKDFDVNDARGRLVDTLNSVGFYNFVIIDKGFIGEEFYFEVVKG